MLLRSAWLYTRGKESVRIELRDEDTRFLLVVNGPGPEWFHQICSDRVEALQAQLAREAQLVADGFLLEGFEQFQSLRRTPGSALRLGHPDPPAPRGADEGPRESR